MSGLKPIAVVIEDEWQSGTDPRGPLLKELIGEEADIRVVDYFTRPSFNLGEVGEAVTPAAIAGLKPALIILDLSLIRRVDGSNSPERGITVLAMLRQVESLKSTPVLIVSSCIDDQRIQSNLRRLGATELFDWGKLRSDGQLQLRFRQAVAAALGRPTVKETGRQ